ncbi:hypothetical protein F4781DRAFT_438634 [Annulohypoxylon bovei var. microspora]|nr:hypothetical protein F4781DRAFT_438634 [Annulohypoxylon bovei var. microspora]
MSFRERLMSRTGSSNTPPMPRCPKCKATFPTREDLNTHQHQVGHFICGMCDVSFHTIEALFTHRMDDHKAAQDLTCPGCTKNFTSTGGWIHHIETGDCYAIFPSDISQGIATVMDAIPKNLMKAQMKGEGKVDFSGPSHIRDAWGDEWTDEQSLDAQKQPEKFPRTAKQEYYYGGSKQPDLLTGTDDNNLEQKPGNAWAQKKNLFPEKAKQPVVAPQQSSFEDLEEPAPSSQSTGQRILDPNHKDFNVAVFWNSILETYNCPHRTCKAKFSRAKKLVEHLKSSAHSGVEFSCPGCRAKYTSASSWVQHVETVNLSKCRVRESREIYGFALNQITDGALDVDALNELPNDTAKVKIVEDWAKAKQPPKNDFVPGTNEYAIAKQAEVARSKANPNEGSNRRRW